MIPESLRGSASCFMIDAVAAVHRNARPPNMRVSHATRTEARSSTAWVVLRVPFARASQPAATYVPLHRQPAPAIGPPAGCNTIRDCATSFVLPSVGGRPSRSRISRSQAIAQSATGLNQLRVT